MSMKREIAKLAASAALSYAVKRLKEYNDNGGVMSGERFQNTKAEALKDFDGKHWSDEVYIEGVDIQNEIQVNRDTSDDLSYKFDDYLEVHSEYDVSQKEREAELQFIDDNDYSRLYISHESEPFISEETGDVHYLMAISHANDVVLENSDAPQKIHDKPMLNYGSSMGTDKPNYHVSYTEEQRNKIHEHLNGDVFLGRVNGMLVDTNNLAKSEIGFNHDAHVSNTTAYRAGLEAAAQLRREERAQSQDHELSR